MWPFPVFANAALTLATERLFGYPDWLYRRIGHPVEWLGGLLAWLEASLNRPYALASENRWRGAAALAILIAATFLPSLAFSRMLAGWSSGWIIEAILATAFLAQKSLADHVVAVRRALDVSLDAGRTSVSAIVGRDPAELDESGVCRAALESLAENTSDGIVAPALWYALGGLPALAVYKAINTADSMIGHRSERYLHFGWAAAKLDDLVNFPASRLAGLVFAVAGGSRFTSAIAAMRRDAARHVSPNAGWPEAAFAEALELQFGGPRSYGGRLVNLATMGSGRAALSRADIDAGLSLYGRAMTLLFLLALCGAIVF